MKFNTILFVICLFLVIRNGNTQLPCPGGYYYDSTIGCVMNGIQISSNFCGGTLYLGFGSGDPCGGGYYATVGYTNTITIRMCEGVYPETWWTVGSCNGNFERLSYTATLSGVNRFLTVSACAGTAMFVIDGTPNGSPSSTSSQFCGAYGSYPSVVSNLDFQGYGYFLCPSGFSYPLPCYETDECSINNGGCQQGCTNLYGSYQCYCYGGYFGSNICYDVDECGSNNGGCQQICNNVPGSYSCSCRSGYSQSGFYNCQNNNECLIGNGGCMHNCTDTDGSYQCSCAPGYQLQSDRVSCYDIDECGSNNGGCQQICNNVPGSYSCGCRSGYSQNGFYNCENLNECLIDNGGCMHNCTDTDGSFECSCASGYQLQSDKVSCYDIDECKLNNGDCEFECINLEGSYSCSSSSVILKSFTQKPNSFNRFIVIGKGFESQSKVKVGTIDCEYISGNSTFIECSTKRGLQVIGEVKIVNSDLSESNIINYIGAPFISGQLNLPTTQGGDIITLKGSNLYFSNDDASLTIKINKVNCTNIQIISANEIECTIGRGSGKNNQIEIYNQLVSNTDNTLITYSSPIIESTSQVYANSGGILTINGNNFGSSPSKVSINIGSDQQCDAIEIKSDQQLTCKLKSSNVLYSQIIDFTVDQLKSNDYYFTFSTLNSDQCESNCNSNGKCTEFGCVCDKGFTGISCNETSGGELITTKPPQIENPSIEIGIGTNSSFSYNISIIRIEELDILNQKVSSYELLHLKWNIVLNSTNKWIYNITLPNNSLLECEFQYFKDSTDISFAKTSITIPNDSLKLSIKVQDWIFKSKLNSLRIVVESDTKLNQLQQECLVIDQLKSNHFNQNLWITTKNSESGLVARFIKYAFIDQYFQIIAKIEHLSSPNKLSSLIGISVPYFNQQVQVDPDWSVLLNLNNNNKQTGSCNKKKSTNWKLATGLSIGGAGIICIIAVGIWIRKSRLNKQKFLNILKSKNTINNNQN